MQGMDNMSNVKEISNQFKALFEEKKKDFDSYLSSRSKSDFEELGEFFHLHVLVEDAILSFIKSENPNIGGLEKGANQFMVKLKIAQNMNAGKLISKFNKPLQAFNEIRNAIGHHPLTLFYPPEKIKVIRESIKNERFKFQELDDFHMIKAFCIIFCTSILALIAMKEMERKAYEASRAAQEQYTLNLEGLLNKIIGD